MKIYRLYYLEQEYIPSDYVDEDLQYEEIEVIK